MRFLRPRGFSRKLRGCERSASTLASVSGQGRLDGIGLGRDEEERPPAYHHLGSVQTLPEYRQAV